VVNLGPRDTLNGRLEIHGDLKIQGNVEGELKASGDVTIDPTAAIQASIEGSNVNVKGQVTGNVTAKKRLTLGGSGRLNGDVKVARLTVEDGATLNGNVTMAPEKG
jgi:cytoskeletal protein CcmA (bactofilin family)